MTDNGLVLFAKAPVPGRVKSRLIPHLAPEQACALYQAFVRDSLDRFHPKLPHRRYLACYPSSCDPFFKSLRGEQGVELLEQAGSDLGERMAGVVRDLLGRGLRQIVLVGADSPTLPAERLDQAFQALRRRPVVIGPSRDGGYYLIGMSRWIPHLFRGIAWGTDGVMSQTTQVLNRAGMQWEMLPGWFDVDDQASLEELRRELSRDTRLAPRTRGILEKISAVTAPEAYR